MRLNCLRYIPALLLLLIGTLVNARQNRTDDKFVSYIVDSKKQAIKLYWKDDRQVSFNSIEHLRIWLGKKQQTLVFAMNGGMYKKSRSPLGLYIENGTILSPLDTSSGNGNFYLKPNGVFCISIANVPSICNATDFTFNHQVKYATQSGPMMIINGRIHPAFRPGSVNLNIRNGLGVLPGNKVIFAMSKKEINFYDFASYFKSMGCINALYLDGFVSRTYLPAQHWAQTDGNFGVIIGISTAKE